ncbi:hypothetical protein NSTC731_00990 [Nostoc sp. DSM 114167]|jgi:hypothetical protein
MHTDDFILKLIKRSEYGFKSFENFRVRCSDEIGILFISLVYSVSRPAEVLSKSLIKLGKPLRTFAFDSALLCV